MAYGKINNAKSALPESQPRTRLRVKAKAKGTQNHSADRSLEPNVIEIGTPKVMRHAATAMTPTTKAIGKKDEEA